MNWFYYLLEANLYLVIFYAFYRLFLHNETFYVVNRHYLLLTSLISFLLPFFQIGLFSTELTQPTTIVFQPVEGESSILSLENILLAIYGMVSFVFLLRILWGFMYLLKLLKKSTAKIENGIRVIELKETKTAFSFFNLLFIDPEISQKNTVLKHEMVHINQKHSFDVLFFELIQILNWFNPITYLLKDDVKLIHEYLADEETTKIDIEKYDYALFLIQNSYGDQSMILTNQIFNSSILKRRISMLNQKKSAKWARLKLLFVLPIAGGMLSASAMAFSKDYSVVDLYPKKVSSFKVSIQDTVKKKSVKKMPPPPPPMEPRTIKTKRTSPPPPVEKIVFPPPAVKPKKAEVVEVEVINPNLKEKVVKGYQAPPPPPVEPKNKVERIQIKPLKSKSSLKPVKVQGYVTPPPPPPVERVKEKKSN